MFPARFCITYKYGENAPLALDDINFSIQKGKVTAIVGPSGCGKTTLVEIFSGVIPKLIGNGVLSGSFDIPDDALVSVVSQNPENQLFGYGVEDAIAFGLENIGMPQEQISERMEYVLDLLNLQYLRKRSVSNLSGGQRQAVCIASVLAMSPDILIMDEPVSSLDPNGKALVRSILVQLSADNNTVVVVDNNLSWSAGIVDHVIGLLDGKVVFDGDRDTFFRDFELQKKLGVIIPQEVEIYRALARNHPDLPMFYTMEEGGRYISELLGGKRGSGSEPPAVEENETVISVHSLSQTFSDGFHALIDVNANLPEGKVIAILGQNGSGKTTFIKLLCRLYDPTEGEILLNGVNIQKYDYDEYMSVFSVVFQDFSLFSFKIGEVVASSKTFDENKVRECLQKANFGDKLHEMPEGVHTYLYKGYDQSGIEISGGEAQKIALARALYKDSPFILLDEPTAALDPISEYEVYSNFNAISGDKTTVYISHRLASCRFCNKIVVFDDGKIVQHGSHEELLSDVNGKYHELWNAQAQYYTT